MEINVPIPIWLIILGIILIIASYMFPYIFPQLTGPAFWLGIFLLTIGIIIIIISLLHE